MAERLCSFCQTSYDDPDVEICPKEACDGRHLVSREDFEGADEDPLLGSVLDGRYVLRSKLGAGGMGQVFRAEQTAMGRQVAVKMLRSDLGVDDTLIARFRREAMTSSKLEHPNTVTVFDFGTTKGGDLYLVMELLKGVSLRERIQESGRLDGVRVIHLARQIARSVAEAHKKGMVHRDLKPANVQVMEVEGDPDFVKVLDFGLAKLKTKEGEEKDQTLTTAGSALGTPLYMSPEQCSGASVDHRTDIYALGVILYQMVSGRPPFVGESSMMTITMHLRDPVPLISDLVPSLRVPASLEGLIRKCLEKDPEKRFADMEAVVDGLDSVRTSVTGEVRDRFSGVRPASEATRDDVSTVPEWSPGSDETFAPESGKSLPLISDLMPRAGAKAPVSMAETMASDPALSAAVAAVLQRSGESAVAGELSARQGISGLDVSQLQSAQMPAPSSSITMVLAAIGLLAVGGGGAWWFLVGSKVGTSTGVPSPSAITAPAAVQAAPGPAPAPAPAVAPTRTVRLRITGTPAGAKVRVAGRLAGSLPTEYDLRTSENSVVVLVEKAGYKPFDRELLLADAKDGVLSMVVELAGTAPIKAVAKPAKKRRKRASVKSRAAASKADEDYEEFDSEPSPAAKKKAKPKVDDDSDYEDF